MISTNLTENVLTQDIAGEDYVRMDQLDSFSSLFYGNTMSLIMLRLSGSTMVSMLPKCLFRCILEYQLSRLLLWRCSDPYVPINHS